MSVIVNYLKQRVEILNLNIKTGIDIASEEYGKLCKDAVSAIKQVCNGVRGVSPQELTDLLSTITEAPLTGQLRDELRDLFNQKLSNKPSHFSTRCLLTKVELPENYLLSLIHISEPTRPY